MLILEQARSMSRRLSWRINLTRASSQGLSQTSMFTAIIHAVELTKGKVDEPI